MSTHSSKPLRRPKLSESPSPSPLPTNRPSPRGAGGADRRNSHGESSRRSPSIGRPGPVKRGSSMQRMGSPTKVREPVKKTNSTDSKKAKELENENKMRVMVNAMMGEYAENISSSFASVIGDAIALKTLELTDRIVELEFELKTRPTKADLEILLQSKRASDAEVVDKLVRRIEELEEKVVDLEESINSSRSTPPTVLEVSKVNIDKEPTSVITESDNNIYLDEMERLMLTQVNTAIQERQSSLPRAESGKRGSTLDGMFGVQKRGESGVRIRDLLGRWCEESSGVFWTIQSDGEVRCDTGARLTLKDKNKQGVWVVSRSDSMVNTSNNSAFIIWSSKVGRSQAQAIKWTRFQPEKHGVGLIRRTQTDTTEEVTEREDSLGQLHQDAGHLTKHVHRDRGSVSQRKASRPSALGFLKVMRKGVLIEVLAGQLVLSAQEVEPSLTALIQSIAIEINGELVGLDHRLKTPESLAMKIGRDVHDANLKILEEMEKRRREVGSAVALAQESGEKHQKRLKKATMAVMSAVQGKSDRAAMARAHQEESDEAAHLLVLQVEAEVMKMEEKAEKEGRNEVDIASLVWSVSDAIRYTVLISTDKYTRAVENAIARLKSAGLTPASLKNYWGEGDGYQGINDVFFVPCDSSPTGKVKVEIQFHTHESFNHKMAVHGMYEEFRSTRDPTRKVELWKESVRMADEIPVPEGVLELPKLTTQPMPIENTLYVDLIISRALRIQQKAVDMISEVCSTLVLSDRLITVKGKVDSHLLSPNAVEMRMDSEVANGATRRGDVTAEIAEMSEMKLKDAALNIDDALVVTVVFDEDVYADATEEALIQIFKSTAMVEVKTFNAWTAPMVLERSGASGGVGIYAHVTMEGEDDGVAFTPDDAYPLVIAFHTPKSLTARIGLQSAWSEYRAANTSKQRNAAMIHAHRLSESVSVPTGARSVRGPKWLLNAIDEGEG